MPVPLDTLLVLRYWVPVFAEGAHWGIKGKPVRSRRGPATVMGKPRTILPLSATPQMGRPQRGAESSLSKPLSQETCLRLTAGLSAERERSWHVSTRLFSFDIARSGLLPALRLF